MHVALGFKRLLEDEIPISMICNHDVLIAQACPDRKSTRAVRVQFAERQVASIGMDKSMTGLGKPDEALGWRGLVDRTF